MREREWRLAIAIGEIEDDEALHLEAIDQDRAEVPRTRRRFGCAIGGNQPANRNAAEAIHLRQRCVEDFTADILVIDIDPPRAG